MRTGRQGKPYSEEEDAIIRKMRASGAKHEDVAKALGRGLGGVSRRARRLEVRRHAPDVGEALHGRDRAVPSKCPMAPSLERAGIWYEDVKLKKVARRSHGSDE